MINERGITEGQTSDIPLKSSAHCDSRLEDARSGQTSVSWTINLELSSHFSIMWSSSFQVLLPLFSSQRWFWNKNASKGGGSETQAWLPSPREAAGALLRVRKRFLEVLDILHPGCVACFHQAAADWCLHLLVLTVDIHQNSVAVRSCQHSGTYCWEMGIKKQEEREGETGWGVMNALWA